MAFTLARTPEGGGVPGQSGFGFGVGSQAMPLADDRGREGGAGSAREGPGRGFAGEAVFAFTGGRVAGIGAGAGEGEWRRRFRRGRRCTRAGSRSSAMRRLAPSGV